MNGGTSSATESEDAVREALLSAIVHREYSFRGSTIINF
jgi:predicted HTH transcriptional regulator